MELRGRGGGPLTAPGQERRAGSDVLRTLLEVHLEPGYEAAARRRETIPGSAARTGAGTLVRAAVLLAVGMLLAVAYTQASAGAPLAARTRAGLAQDARSRAALTDRLQRQAAAARSQLSLERARALADSAAGRELAARLRSLEVGASLVALSGTGLVVTVTDAPIRRDPVTGQAPATDPTGPGRIQDRDLAAIVNGLWAAGAEAVSVDGQRLSPVSTIRSAGGAILVDFRPVSSPYTIHAIGQADRMQAQFADSPISRSFAAITQLYGMSFTVRRQSRVDVPAAPAVQPVYAVPRISGR